MPVKKINYQDLLTALAAGVGYGGWAAYANFEHGGHIWMMAAMVQGIYAFFSTLFITHCARLVFIRSDCGIKGVIAGFTASFILMLAIPLSVHTFIATPDIWQTILPGLIWGSIYLMSFLISMHFKTKTAVAESAEDRLAD